MWVQTSRLVRGMALILALGLLAGCASTAKKPVGAHARAEKGMPTGGAATGEGEMVPRGDIGTQRIITDLDPNNQYNLCQKIYFDYDKSDLKPDAIACLEKLASFLRDHANVNLVIERHCDERGTNEYNLALGERRAESAKGYLAEHGINASRIITRSWGEEKPIETCSNESCWKVNRRAEFFGVQQ